MKKQELYNKVIAYFQEAMPVAETELHYNNPFELLIAVITVEVDSNSAPVEAVTIESIEVTTYQE